MQVFKRERYLARIRPFMRKQLIKVLTGQRRVGKSYLLRQIRDEILAEEPEAHFIELDLERFDFHHIRTAEAMYAFIAEREQEGQMNYLFVDEIQEVESFERVLRHYHAQGNFDIYCTGSNAQLLSGELATYLSGRQIELQVHPLSFEEFLQFHRLEANQESLNKYMQFGGMPYLIHLGLEREVVHEYLQAVLSAILFRDIALRHKLRDLTFLQNLTSFLADHTDSLVSASSISKYLKAQGLSKSIQTVVDYLTYLRQAFLVNELRRYDIKGKRIFETSSKFFFEDIGLRNVLSGFSAADIHKVMENVVYNHLRIHNYQVYVGKLRDAEIDFVAQKGDERKYIQVAYRLDSEQTIRREFGNLLAIKDNYPKMVVTLEESPATSSYQGIEHYALLRFLKTIS